MLDNNASINAAPAKVNSPNINLSFVDKGEILLNAVPSAVVYIDKHEYLKYVNKSFENIFGVKAVDVLGRSVMNFLGHDAYQTVKGYRDAALAGQPSKNELEVTFKDGKRFIEISYTPDMDEQNNVAGYIVLVNDITAKRETAEKLERRQSELEDYVNNAVVGMHWVNADGLIIWANQAELDMLGYSEEEYISHHIAEFHSHKNIVDDILFRLKAKERLHEYEAELKCKDGKTRRVLINSNGLWEGDKFIHTRCFTIDITTRKEAEAALQESQRRYKQLVESLPIALYTCDKNGYIDLFNKAAVELWGREPEIGKDRWCGSAKIFEPDGVTPLALEECPMAVSIKEGRTIRGREIIVERPEGQKKRIHSYPSPLYDSKGDITGGVNMLLDVTDKKEAEDKLAWLAAIVQYSNDPIVSKTLDGIITSWNEAAERVFGYSSKEMVGQSITRIIPQERLSEETLILNRLKKGYPVEHFETKRLTKNNQVLDVSLTSSPIKDKEGKVIGASKIVRDITSQKKLYEALRESEERLRMAIKTTNLGTWEYYPLTGKLSWSDECRKIYDVPVDMKINYQFFSEHIHPDDADFVQERIEEAMHPDLGGDYDLQYRIIRYSDKQPRWIRAQGKIYFNVFKQAERFIGTVVDITEEKEIEEELKNNVELFTTMADNVPAMIWMSGNDKYSDFFNKTWLEFTGRTLEMESKEGWLQNVHPEDVQKCIDGYNQAFLEQKGYYTEYRLRRHDGQYRWIADNSVPRHNPDGSFAGFISACIDIEDQKKARERILASELKLKTISNASPVGLWMTDANGQNIFVNDTWIEWTDIPYEKQLGNGWLSKVIEEDRITAPAKFRECMLKREKYSTEFRMERSDGNTRWCLTEGFPYYDIDGEFKGYAGSVTDITDIKKMEERKDDFIKMASHELKTPITSIKGYVQLLMSIYDELNEEKFNSSRSVVRSSLQTISKQVGKLTRLVSELLDLTRIESGKLELYKTFFDLDSLVEETVQDVRLTTSRHAIIVHNNFRGTIYGDKDRINQVLMNLITNAVKYSPDADHIEVFVTGNKEVVTIKVKDRGIGIEEKDHSRIFERFYRVEGKSEQTYPGFGIGLFIAAEIIQRHNGSIKVESEKGKGSEFIISLPVKLIE
ncbi:MAG TPA: PAS domain S-box protein [Chitinophagaceae bacterium]|nr:PAS domain S-box protein [Chitinophagaceae bacterium]